MVPNEFEVESPGQIHFGQCFFDIEGVTFVFSILLESPSLVLGIPLLVVEV